MSEATREPGGCVICGKPKDEKYKPFCSKRCADVDLNRWFSGHYAIRTEEEEPSSGDEKQ
jgi:hypothetical protein